MTGEPWWVAALRPPDRFTLTRARGGYHTPTEGQVSAVDFTNPVIRATKPSAGNPFDPPPGPVRIRLNRDHPAYTITRDMSGAVIEIPHPQSIQIGDPPVAEYIDPFEAVRRQRHQTAPPLRDSARQAYALREARRLLAEARVPADIVMRRPQWKAGDVIVVEYAPGQPYTYVRGQETWPVDKGRTPKTDDDINRLWDNGQVRPVLQAGGTPFPHTRLP